MSRTARNVTAPGRASPRPEEVTLYVGPRQLDHERRAGARRRADVEPTAHALHELARDVEAEPGASLGPRQLRPGAVELLEDPLLLGERDAGAGVGDEDEDGAVVRLDADAHRAVAAVFDRVVEEVDED